MLSRAALTVVIVHDQSPRFSAGLQTLCDLWDRTGCVLASIKRDIDIAAFVIDGL